MVGRDSISDLYPAFSIVSGFEQVGSEIVTLVGCGGKVESTGFKRVSFDRIDLNVGRQTAVAAFGGDIIPALTTIPADVYHAIIGSGPYDT